MLPDQDIVTFKSILQALDQPDVFGHSFQKLPLKTQAQALMCANSPIFGPTIYQGPDRTEQIISILAQHPDQMAPLVEQMCQEMVLHNPEVFQKQEHLTPLNHDFGFHVQALSNVLLEAACNPLIDFKTCVDHCADHNIFSHVCFGHLSERYGGYFDSVLDACICRGDTNRASMLLKHVNPAQIEQGIIVALQEPNASTLVSMLDCLIPHTSSQFIKNRASGLANNLISGSSKEQWVWPKLFGAFPLKDAIDNVCGKIGNASRLANVLKYPNNTDFVDRLWHYATDEQKQALPNLYRDAVLEHLSTHNAPLFHKVQQAQILKEALTHELDGSGVAQKRSVKM